MIDMQDKITDTKFLVFCRKTCIVGSENGECPCLCPNQCTMIDHPDFPQARVEAERRQMKVFHNDHVRS